MAEFDPSTRALVHDNLNDQVIAWEPEMHQQDYERYATRQFGNGTTEWDGLLLDGWKPLTLH